jgi:hypothetical protein
VDRSTNQPCASFSCRTTLKTSGGRVRAVIEPPLLLPTGEARGTPRDLRDDLVGDVGRYVDLLSDETV